MGKTFDSKKILIFGGGPNRIGLGIEFDYCCVHSSFGLKEEGYKSIMVNCNPETVSTDYDTSDTLYFEPITIEDVLNIAEKEKSLGIIVQFDGQIPLTIAVPLKRAGIKVLGTDPNVIDMAEDSFTEEIIPEYFCAKESVFPFNKFSGTDYVLGPEMKSTGEVMGIDKSFEMAYAKNQISAGQKLPLNGKIFISVRDRDKPAVVDIAREFQQMGFTLFASTGTARYLSDKSIDVVVITKISGSRQNIIDYIKNNEISIIINTPSGKNQERILFQYFVLLLNI